MKISYKRLWKLLIDHNMKKSELRKAVNIGPATMTKINKNEAVSIDVLIKICSLLQCDIGDIITLVPDDEN